MEAHEPLLEATVSFRAPQKMVDDIEAYRRMRRLPKTADACRELMEGATTATELLTAAADDIEAYRRMRRLPKTADACRELMEGATTATELLTAAAEAAALGLKPVAILRERIAQLSSQ